MNNPQPIASDEPERIVLSNINEYGWHAVNVIEDDNHPPWSFTIGLFETWDHPELIIIGRSRATSYEMLNTLVNEIETHSPLDLKEPDGYMIVGMRCHFLKVSQRYYSDYVGF